MLSQSLMKGMQRKIVPTTSISQESGAMNSFLSVVSIKSLATLAVKYLLPNENIKTLEHAL
jgi:hypothetical protein